MGPVVADTFYPTAQAMVDDAGVLSMRDLERRCDAVAQGLSAAGLWRGDGVGLLARNSAAFYEVAVGASRLGLDVTYLNTGFTADQIADVVERQAVRAVVYDEEFTDRVPAQVLGIPTTGAASIATMAVAGRAGAVRAPTRPSRHTILTSGTTGAPKGVPRTGGGVDSVLALLSGLPLRVRERHLIAAPMFHAWGWLHMMLSMLLSSTVVVTRRFDPERVLALVERERCHVLIAVPAMLRRMLDLPAAIRRRYDTTSLRVVAVSGSALSGRLAREFMDEFGEIVFSLYGSTEAGFATVASPADLRAAPGCAGRVLPTVTVEVLDERGRPCAPGVPGAITVSSRDTVVVGGDADHPAVARTGDFGWFDADGRLFVGARADDMVIVGGENVYPVTVEHVLEDHTDVVEAAVVGTPDRVLGQALVAYVRLRAGSATRADDIVRWCGQHLAPFQVPRRVVVVDQALPRNETGKVVKRELRS
jgi:fatty-acyl-CoA synthase